MCSLQRQNFAAATRNAEASSASDSVAPAMPSPWPFGYAANQRHIHKSGHSLGAVRESRWPFWAVRPNEPSGFRGRKAILNHASALVSACP